MPSFILSSISSVSLLDLNQHLRADLDKDRVLSGPLTNGGITAPEAANTNKQECLGLILLSLTNSDIATGQEHSVFRYGAWALY